MKSIRNNVWTVVVMAMAGVNLGCGRDVRLAGKKVRHVEIKPVTHFGMDLDETASPEQVVYVALRAIREDVFAKSSSEREAAQDIQFDTAAADVIEVRNRGSLARDEFIHHVVTHWTPAVSHYAGDFETDWEKARARMVNRGVTKAASGDISETELAMVVSDRSGDPAASVVMRVWLARDGGMWRVTHLGFEPRRTLGSARSTTG